MSFRLLSRSILRSDSLTRHIATNTASYLITLGAAFLMFPIMIHRLGAARYGLWMLVVELTGYYAYIGTGIRAGVVYFASTHMARGERRELSVLLSTAFWSLAAAGAVFAISSFGLAALFPLLFPSSGFDREETARAIVLMSFSGSMGLPIEAMFSALTASKRLDIVNGIDMVTRTVCAVSMLICVWNGGGLVPLSLIQVAAKLIVAPFTYWMMHRVIPGLSLSFHNLSLECLKRLGRFALPSMLIGVGWLVSSRTDLMVIGSFIGVPLVAYYAIPRSLMEYADTGVRAMAWSFTSHLTHLHAQDKTDDVVQLYLRGSRLMGLAVSLLAAGIAAFGTSFLALWQGAAYVTGDWRNRSSVVLLILVAAFLPRLIQNMASQLLYATNRLTFLMWSSLLEGVIKIVLSLLLVKPWGLAGVAVSNLIPMVLFEGVAIPIYLFRRYPIPLAGYLRDVLGRSLLVGAAIYIVGAALVSIHAPTSWIAFLAEISAASLAGLAAAAASGALQSAQAERS